MNQASSPQHVLVITKGHDFDHSALHEMFAALPNIETTFVEHPAAQWVLRPNHVDEYDVIFFYDMCGIPQAGMHHDRADQAGWPCEDYAQSIEHLIASGKGLILVNHAIVSWPHWPLWREISGSSFMLTAGELWGQPVPGSGYRGGHGPLPNPTFTLQPADPDHPVVQGLAEGFSLTDELYLKTKHFEDHIVPLLRSDYEFVDKNFSPPPLAPADEQRCWQHPQGSDVVVWANAARQSPVVVSDVGDGPLAFANPGYRTLIHNAIHWVASDAARQWATQTSEHR